jgi:hypothetical protein
MMMKRGLSLLGSLLLLAAPQGAAAFYVSYEAAEAYRDGDRYVRSAATMLQEHHGSTVLAGCDAYVCMYVCIH